MNRQLLVCVTCICQMFVGCGESGDLVDSVRSRNDGGSDQSAPSSSPLSFDSQQRAASDRFGTGVSKGCLLVDEYSVEIPTPVRDKNEFSVARIAALYRQLVDLRTRASQQAAQEFRDPDQQLFGPSGLKAATMKELRDSRAKTLEQVLLSEFLRENALTCDEAQVVYGRGRASGAAPNAP